MDVRIDLDKNEVMKTLNKMERAQFLTGEEFLAAMYEATEYVQTNVEIRTPVWKGIARGSIASQVIRGYEAPGLIRGTVASGLKYMPALEEGSKPHFPPIKALTGKTEMLDLWAKDKGVSAFAVAKAIAKRGTRPRKMFQQGLSASKTGVPPMFERAAARLLDRLKRGN